MRDLEPCHSILKEGIFPGHGHSLIVNGLERPVFPEFERSRLPDFLPLSDYLWSGCAKGKRGKKTHRKEEK